MATYIFYVVPWISSEGTGTGREILHRQLTTKQANPDELKQMPQTCNLETPAPAVCASERTA